MIRYRYVRNGELLRRTDEFRPCKPCADKYYKWKPLIYIYGKKVWKQMDFDNKPMIKTKDMIPCRRKVIY